MAEQNVDTTITQEHVAEAEAKAAEAAAFVEALERRIASGDDTVTLDELEAQEKVSRFAKLRATGMAEKAKRAREWRRQSALRNLRIRVDAVTAERGAKAADLLKAVRDAEIAFLAFTEDQNQQLSAWLREAATLGVNVTNQNIASEKVDAGLAIRDGLGALIAGQRLVQRLPGRELFQYVRETPDEDVHLHYENLAAIDGTL